MTDNQREERSVLSQVGAVFAALGAAYGGSVVGPGYRSPPAHVKKRRKVYCCKCGSRMPEDYEDHRNWRVTPSRRSVICPDCAPPDTDSA